MNIISISKLSKYYKNTKALDNVSFKVKKGEIFGLLGPNGAGKTTLISILSTILLPTKGKIKINNLDLLKESKEIRKIIGLVFQESILDEGLNAYDNLDIHARLYKIPKEVRKRKINELLNLVNLEDVSKKKVSKFSWGMKRKLELIRGMINEPKILFLDEPTLGLDPHARRAIWDYIKKLNKEGGTTIILTTHYMDEADSLCDRIGIINHGKLIKIDSSKKLKSLLKKKILKKPTLEDVFLHFTKEGLK